MNKETKRAAQSAYREARAFGHSKQEAQSIRDNWKSSPRTSSTSSSDDDDDEYYTEYSSGDDHDCVDE